MLRVRLLEERTKAIHIYSEADRNVHEVERVFNGRLSGNPIFRIYVTKLLRHFEEPQILAGVKGAERKSISEEQQVEIATSMVNNPECIWSWSIPLNFLNPLMRFLNNFEL